MELFGKIGRCAKAAVFPERGGTCEVRTPWLLRAIYLYLALPFVIFALGWMRPYIGIPAVLIVCVSLYFAFRDAPSADLPRVCRKTLPYLCAALVVIVFIVIFSGIGGISYQNRDHYWRNAVLETLCRASWPVRDVWPDGTQVGLIYYIGFWLPAALFGKVFGVDAAQVFLLIWTILGVLLFFGAMATYLKKRALWIPLLFFFFGGMDVLVHLHPFSEDMILGFAHMEWTGYSPEVITFQYSSFTTQLYWVFNQALPAWLFVMAILLQDKNKHVVLLLGLMPLCSSLPFVGLLPFAVYLMLRRRYRGADGTLLCGKAHWAAFCKDTFSFSNVAGGGVAGLLSAAYLFGNARVGAGQSDGGKGFHFVGAEYPSFLSFLWMYAVFVLTEFLVYWLLLYRYAHRKPMYHLTLVVLLITPLFAFGLGYDFCMRVSIPALLVLFLMIAQALPQVVADLKKTRPMYVRLLSAALLICLLLGARAPFNEVARSIERTAHKERWAGSFELMQDPDEGNFVHQTEGSFFYRYIAARQEE